MAADAASGDKIKPNISCAHDWLSPDTGCSHMPAARHSASTASSMAMRHGRLHNSSRASGGWLTAMSARSDSSVSRSNSGHSSAAAQAA